MQSEQEIRALACRLDRIRAYRAPARDTSIAQPVRDLQTELRRAARRGAAVERLAAAWGELLPQDLSDRCAPVALCRGVLELACDDGGVRFQTDRWLRAGGYEAVVRACGSPVRRVKLSVAEGGLGRIP